MQPETPISISRPVTRVRRRLPYIPSPPITSRTTDETIPIAPERRTRISTYPSQLSTAIPSPSRPGWGSDGPTIRGIRTAFAETPVKLRELEIGWREKRRLGLAERRQNEAVRGEAKGKRIDVGGGSQDCNRLKAKGRAICHNRVDKEETGRRDEGTRRNLEVDAAKRTERLTRLSDETDDYLGLNQKLPPRKIMPFVPSSPPLTPPFMPMHLPPLKTALPNCDDNEYLPKPYKARAGIPKSSYDTPVPILSSPLPPTTHPMPLSKRSRDTIHVHPSPSNTGITLNLGNSELRISADGKRTTFLSMGRKGLKVDRTLALASVEKWSEGDGRDWGLVSRLIKGYKRHIPKVRLYLPLGHILITCSSPPDVIISFDIMPTKAQREKTPEPDAQSVKVRLRLSKINNEITIDTSSTPQRGERVRTRRSLRIDPDTGTCGTGETPLKKVDLTERLVGVLERSKEWSEVEREGLRRLIHLKEEWERYG